MEEMDAYLTFQVDKEITLLYKRQLEELECLRSEHRAFVARVKANIPQEHAKIVEAASFLDDNSYAIKRKRILDEGNAAKRAILLQLSKFSLTLKR